MKERNKIVILTMCVSMMISLVSCENKEPEPITEFSTDNWLAVEWDQRYHMLEDLYTEEELIGMSAEEVEELLGQPGAKDASYSNGAYICSNWRYYVRYDSWHGWEVLVIDFQEDMVNSYNLSWDYWF